MPSKKYTVRDGFVVPLVMSKTDGSTYIKMIESNEDVTLDDDIAALHMHKLEFTSQKDRDAALQAEKDAATAKAAAASPVDLMAAVSAMLATALAQAGVAPASAPAPTPAT